MSADPWVLEHGVGWVRTDDDGTVWTITLNATGGATLTMRYRDHRLTSTHANTQAAKRHLDHVIPMSKGGGHTYANTQCSHLKCNVDKGARIAEEGDPLVAIA